MRVAVLLLVSCSEYDVKGELPSQAALDETAPATTLATTPSVPMPEPTCATADLGAWRWVTSSPIWVAADPTDAVGRPFYDPEADTADWTAIALPHRDIPIGTDRAYVGTATLAEVPVNLSLELQTDDGVALWVNGRLVGQWGDWQQEGCVNEQAECLITTTVAPVDVTPFLQVGRNVIAARVTNPVLNAWFEVAPRCLE